MDITYNWEGKEINGLGIPIEVIKDMGVSESKIAQLEKDLKEFGVLRAIDDRKGKEDIEKGVEKVSEKGKDSREIEYLVIPFEIIDSKSGMEMLEEAGITIPDIELLEHEIIGSESGIVGQFVGVVWKEPTRIKVGSKIESKVESELPGKENESTGKEKVVDYIKPYDVRGHIVYAGCEFESTTKEIDRFGKEVLQCENGKNIYIVLHQIDEWISWHTVGLDKDRRVKELK